MEREVHGTRWNTVREPHASKIASGALHLLGFWSFGVRLEMELEFRASPAAVLVDVFFKLKV